MERTITVKGTGTAAFVPDRAEIPITLVTQHQDYEQTVRKSGEQLAQLRESLQETGFAREDIKTRSFDVSPQHESERGADGEWHRVFKGYRCTHALCVSFERNPDRLARVLSMLAACPAKPDFSVRFTVSDRNAVSRKLLQSAAENAREKAGLLCEASGVRLGELVNIDYSWGELNVYSAAEIGFAAKAQEDFCPDIEPEEIENSETVTFVWRIEKE